MDSTTLGNIENCRDNTVTIEWGEADATGEYRQQHRQSVERVSRKYPIVDAFERDHAEKTNRHDPVFKA